MLNKKLLFRDFVEDLGWEGTDHNYKLYKWLELLYMNDNMTNRESIYELGKKLITSDDAEAAMIYKKYIQNQIARYESQIDEFKKEIEYTERTLPIDDNNRSRWIRIAQEAIKVQYQYIKDLEWILGLTYYINNSQN